mmetsp:Transcript_4579/g.17308  ORF Transcript_4579/g.17308 Transcript_4579/m.17308 type:complete len:235 (-) Transcript_4579:207-911(-)
MPLRHHLHRSPHKICKTLLSTVMGAQISQSSYQVILRQLPSHSFRRLAILVGNKRLSISNSPNHPHLSLMDNPQLDSSPMSHYLRQTVLAHPPASLLPFQSLFNAAIHYTDCSRIHKCRMMTHPSDHATNRQIAETVLYSLMQHLRTPRRSRSVPPPLWLLGTEIHLRAQKVLLHTYKTTNFPPLSESPQSMRSFSNKAHEKSANPHPKLDEVAPNHNPLLHRGPPRQRRSNHN